MVIDGGTCRSSGNAGGTGGGPLYMIGGENDGSSDINLRRLSSSRHGGGIMSLLCLDSVGQRKLVKLPASTNFWETRKGVGGLNPLRPASLKGLAPIGRYNWPYRVSAPWMGSKGMSLAGYGDRSAACFFCVHLGWRQCSIE